MSCTACRSPLSEGGVTPPPRFAHRSHRGGEGNSVGTRTPQVRRSGSRLGTGDASLDAGKSDARWTGECRVAKARSLPETGRSFLSRWDYSPRNLCHIQEASMSQPIVFISHPGTRARPARQHPPSAGHTLGVGKRVQERHLGPLFVDVGKIHQRSPLLNFHGPPDLSRQRCELLQPFPA
jgi:hypothetical protein